MLYYFNLLKRPNFNTKYIKLPTEGNLYYVTKSKMVNAYIKLMLK